MSPRAAADRIDGWARDADGRPVLAVRVRAAPVEGEANVALEALLAKALGVRRTDVTVVRGGRGRLKTVAIDGVPAETVEKAFGSPQRGQGDGGLDN